MPSVADDHWRIPVLLTSSVIAHDRRVALHDEGLRIDYALESVARWLELYPQIRLVLCDGSNYDFTSLVAEKFPAASIECLFFENDQEAVRRQGRGFGEGEIVRHAITNSQWIGEAGAFAKCTSKLWVRNYAECLAEWNGRFLCKAVFDGVFSPFKKVRLAYIDTRFYLANTAYYQHYFEMAHQQIDVDKGKGLEDCFMEVVNKNNLEGLVLTTPPIIDGLGGGIGKYYKNPWKRRIKEHVRLYLVRRQAKFKALFTKQH
jgi:hypothetical protein